MFYPLRYTCLLWKASLSRVVMVRHATTADLRATWPTGMPSKRDEAGLGISCHNQCSGKRPVAFEPLEVGVGGFLHPPLRSSAFRRRGGYQGRGKG